MIDPFSKEVGLTLPRFHDNIILISHDHYDHNYLKGVEVETMVVNGPGEYERQGLYILGIQSFHDSSQGSQRGLNTIFCIQAEEMRFCHMGDFGQDKLDESQLEAIGGVDVLMIPIGGVYTIDGKLASQITEQIQPKIVIPMHYKIPGLRINLEGPDKFLKELGIKAEKVDKLKINKRSLPMEEIKLVMFT